MASGLYTLSTNLSKNICQCLKHSIPNTHPPKTKWRTITSLSFNSGFVDETYSEVKKCDNATRPLDLYALKQKEKEDWRNLSLQEKQALYHMSFSQPLCLAEQPSDEWKLILAGTFTAMGLMTLGLYMWLSRFERTENVIGPLSPKSKEEMSCTCPDQEISKSS
ncbi:uncharacterized protein [Parasteatoda tepidariorum]|uniref:uncharacterized protein n=1 Tax=Parasteatoda tepidariorum TaxID=114398 RepID=UPI00077FB5A8|nr:uncharacterized protein LOC107448168 [Parasteatoda tepidariorum]XP_015918770.1 uncharacterized protein LOC107448168 [Parasteatoda tepidariorum]XP_042900043.1 uncharacterized protein LOC107448168 [Parasteatoda tepidariorum]